MSVDAGGGRAVVDEVSGWLEDSVRPDLPRVRREFIWQYLRIYDQWAQFHVREPGIDAQASLTYLVDCAEQALREIGSRSPTRLLLSVIRSLPFGAVAYSCITDDSQQIGQYLVIASAAACLFGNKDFAVREGDNTNALTVTAEWLVEFKSRLPVDIGRLLGAAHTWYVATGWYRIAGKGGLLAPPSPVDLTAARQQLDRLAPDAIMIVPAAAFINDDEIMPQVLAYDRRTRAANAEGITGVFASDPPAAGRRPDPMSWWRVGLPRNPSSPVEFSVFYPRQNVTLITTTYMLIPDELSPHLDRLSPFASLFSKRLQISFASFALCCRAVAAAVRIATGFMQLKPVDGDEGALRFRADQATREAEQSAASFLYSVTHRGLLRTLRESWIAMMANLLSQGGAADPRQEAQAFIALFTRTRELHADLEPGLFLEVDPQTLALDLLAMSEFFEFCLRKVTSIDDAPSPEMRRGARFEQAAWQFLSRRLRVRLLVDLNHRFASGREQGEVDIAFQVDDDVAVLLECKSWQKNRGYFRGDRRSVERRHEQLRRTVEGQLTRNSALLLRHLGAAAPRRLLTFVCVPGPEFIRQGFPSLWYGATQRVLTPPELAELIADGPRWRETVAAAGPAVSFGEQGAGGVGPLRP